MNSLRKDDLSDSQYQFYSISDVWYFKTLDGETVGPFRYECEARQMLEQLRMERARQPQDSLPSGKLHFRVNPARTSTPSMPAG